MASPFAILATLVVHPITLSCFFSWFIAQALKFIVVGITRGKIDFKEFYSLGGMPSSHTAFVTGLVTSIYLLEGFSTAFFISAVLAIVVIRDAVGVRKVVQDLTYELETVNKKIRGRQVGHTIAQAAMGALIGILVPVLISLIY
jgi:uncharacterized protein